MTARLSIRSSRPSRLGGFWRSLPFLFQIGCGHLTAAPAALEVQTVDLGEGIRMEFVCIASGSFLMGSRGDIGEDDEFAQHRVHLSRSYWLGKTEVTQAQWEKVLHSNPSKHRGATLPVDNVSWSDCQRFLGELGKLTGKTFALPTEAQWEYACRAGTDTPWSFGASETESADFAWTQQNAMGTSHPVGQKKPNAWGLLDMQGNVWEWCSDWYAPSYPEKEVTDPAGPPDGSSRVLRGGAWGDSPLGARSSIRNCLGQEEANEGTGFRCVLVIPNPS